MNLRHDIILARLGAVQYVIAEIIPGGSDRDIRYRLDCLVKGKYNLYFMSCTQFGCWMKTMNFKLGDILKIYANQGGEVEFAEAE